MCGRVIQSSGPLRAKAETVRTRNRQTGELSLDPLRWGLIPYWCGDPKGGRKPINVLREATSGHPIGASQRTAKYRPAVAGQFQLWLGRIRKAGASEHFETVCGFQETAKWCPQIRRPS